jgi:hypothetical protein
MSVLTPVLHNSILQKSQDTQLLSGETSVQTQGYDSTACALLSHCHFEIARWNLEK